MSTTQNETLGKFKLRDEPHYVFDTEGFRNNICELTSAFRNQYDNFTIAYSFKTNYLRAACDTVLETGCYAEVVSPYEYQYAKELGFPNDRIVYNGVIPSYEKYRSACFGCHVNIDSVSDLRAIEAIAEKQGIKATVGVRLNLDSLIGSCSRFGIDVCSDDFSQVMKEISASRYVSFSGFHHHVHGKRNVRHWKQRAEILITLAKEYEAKYIDLGGGMWGKMPDSLFRQFKEQPNSYAEYAESIGGLFATEFPDKNVQLIIEPGIGLIGSAMDCVGHVTGIKTIQGRTYVQLDINGAYTAFDYSCDANGISKPFHILETGYGKRLNLSGACFVGTTCTEIDILVKDFSGRIAVGDTVVFENVGAYSLVTSRQFITPRPGVYDKSNGECLRKPEAFSDFFENYLDI